MDSQSDFRCAGTYFPDCSICSSRDVDRAVTVVGPTVRTMIASRYDCQAINTSLVNADC